MPEEIYDPRERLEIFLNAVRTGDVEGLPDPQTREEMYLAAIASKTDLPDTADASVGDALLLDSDKKPIWGVAGKKLYMHRVALQTARGSFGIAIISDDPTPYTTKDAVAKWLNDHGFSSTSYAYPIGGMVNTTYNTIGLGALSTDGTNVHCYIFSINFTTPGLTADQVLVQTLNSDKVVEI